MTDYTKPASDYGDKMTVDKFKLFVAQGLFNDYDGMGQAMKDDMIAEPYIYPSEVSKIPEDATHILWYNK